MENENREYILRVYGALQEKGYNAVGQIVGYLLTEDPTYITNHLDARRLIRKIDRYGLLADIVANYFDDTLRPCRRQRGGHWGNVSCGRQSRAIGSHIGYRLPACRNCGFGCGQCGQ